MKSKKTDEQAREKAQKAQQDEAERVQQQAANKVRHLGWVPWRCQALAPVKLSKGVLHQ